MKNLKIMWWNILSIVLMIIRGSIGVEKMENAISTSKSLDLFPGFRLIFDDDELRFKINIEDMLPVTAMQSRAQKKEDNHDGKKKGDMQKLGAMMMMIPLIMQMLSIPVAIASIKLSLLKSIFVGKLALLLMLYNLIKSSQQSVSKTVVIQAPAEHHDHFYPHLHEESEENKGWLGWIG